MIPPLTQHNSSSDKAEGFVKGHSELSWYRNLSGLSSWEKWIKIIIGVNYIGFSCYLKDQRS